MKLKRYENYYDSEIDWLDEYPSHWQLLPCRSIVNHIVEKNHKNEYQNYLSLMANVGVIRYEDKGDVGNKKPEDLSNCKIVKRGHLVINSMNYSIGSYGMSPYDGVCSSVYIILEAKPDVVIDRYALRVFENSAFQKHLATFGNGILAHRAAIGWDDIKGEYVPIPPIDEQSKIIEMLDYETAKIDTLIEKQQRLIELLTEKRQAVISHAVTKGLNPDVPMKDSGVEWLGEVPEHWNITKIKYIAELTPSKSEALSHLGGKCSFVPMEKLKRDSLILDETRDVKDVHQGYTYFKDNDILLAKVTPCFENQNIAVAKNLVNGIGFGSSEIFVLRSNNIKLNYFMFYRLQENIFMQMGVGAMTGAGGLQRVPTDFINNFQFALPPLKEAQQIVNYLRDQNKRFDILTSKANQQIQLMQERRTALISAAVTGKIDVRDWVKPE